MPAGGALKVRQALLVGTGLTALTPLVTQAERLFGFAGWAALERMLSLGDGDRVGWLSTLPDAGMAVEARASNEFALAQPLCRHSFVKMGNRQ